MRQKSRSGASAKRGSATINETTRSERDSALRRVLLGIGGIGIVLALAAWWYAGIRPALGVALGSALGAANLWALAWVVRQALRSAGARFSWAVAAGLKFAALVGGIYALVSTGLVDILPLAIGYGALPLATVFAEFPARALLREERRDNA